MIETKLISKENCLAVIETNVSEDAIAEALQSSIKKLNNRVTVPGFRKGKTPIPMLKRYLGDEAIDEEALNSLITNAYYQAVDEYKLKPIADPDFEGLDDVDMKAGKATFTIKVALEPEVKLFDYEEIKLEREERAVTDEDIDKQIEMIRKDYAQYVPTERKVVGEGDLVTMDYKGFVDDVQFPGGSSDDAQLIIGSNRFIPGFEEKMIGLTVGEESEISVTFPLDYHAENLVGKDAKFKILVKDIKVEELPVVDDEFAKDLTDVNSLQELKDRIRHNMTHHVQNHAIRVLGSKVLKEIVEKSEVEIPQVLIDNEVEKNLDRVKSKLKNQGVTYEKYLEVTKKTDEDMRAELEKEAPLSVKTRLVMDEIASKNESLYPMVHEVEHEISHMLMDQGVPANEESKYMHDKKLRSEVAERIMTDKILDFLGIKCDKNPIPECETCKEAHAHHHHNHDDGECGCGHDHHKHDDDCECGHDHEESDCGCGGSHGSAEADSCDCGCDHKDDECECGCNDDESCDCESDK